MKPNPNAERQTILVAALTDPAHYPHPAAAIEHLETHISHILLVGDYAYKIKKPLNLGFVNFTSLARRKFYCEEELRLNRRLAPDLYLDCIPICGSIDNPLLGGDPAMAVEYAVKMRRFSQTALLDRCLAEGALRPRHVDTLARQLAEFHGTVARAGADTPFGTLGHVQQPALDNFAQTRPLLKNPKDVERLDSVAYWTVAAHECLAAVMTERKAAGFIRECHGDLHLGNMILRDEQVIIFDCIEFNDDLRWIDAMSDLAFLSMDLYRCRARGLAWRLLNVYLEFSGDYEGLALLAYYQVYRAMVRAKTAAIRLNQPDLSTQQQNEVQAECRDYLELALSFTRQRPRFLLITHGLSGSGKSTISAPLSETLATIRIRSDVERKRLFGLGPLDSSDSAVNQGIYTDEAGASTYARLRQLAGEILDAGYSVMVDATFLEKERRQTFRALAKQRGVPLVLLVCTTNPATLRERVDQRQAKGGDAAEANAAVLEHQLQNYILPDREEEPLNAEGYNIDALAKAIQARVQAYYNAGH